MEVTGEEEVLGVCWVALEDYTQDHMTGKINHAGTMFSLRNFLHCICTLLIYF